MHPALSVIFFTVVSGCGFGVLFLVAAAILAEPQLPGHDLTVLLLLAGFVMASAGLLSSLLHLGQPQRAWRAFSQWRSSWLSREGVAAIAALAATALLGGLLLTHAGTGALRACAFAVALASTICVICTAQIYATLKTVPAWHNAFVLPGYVLFALLGGSAWLWALCVATGTFAITSALPPLVGGLAIICALHKTGYWRYISAMRGQPTPESATGLGRFGAVRSAEAPHTEHNYLTREMGFALARKHARRLRRICLALIGVIPVLLAALAWLASTSTLQVLYAAAVAVSVTGGLFVERWLFFAEAKHVVMLYYAPAGTTQQA